MIKGKIIIKAKKRNAAKKMKKSPMKQKSKIFALIYFILINI